MKKIFKTAMFAVAVMAAGYGGYKTYSTYTVKDGTLVSENIEALSQSGEGGYVFPDIITTSTEEGYSYARDNEITEVNGVRGFWCHFTGVISDYCVGVIEV